MKNEQIVDMINNLIVEHNNLVRTFDAFALAVENQLDVYATYVAQLDKNIKTHDTIINQLCCSVGIQFNNSKEKYN